MEDICRFICPPGCCVKSSSSGNAGFDRKPWIPSRYKSAAGRLFSQEEEEKLKATIIAATDPVFKVLVKPVREIDWSDNPKQLFFSSSVV